MKWRCVIFQIAVAFVLLGLFGCDRDDSRKQEVRIGALLALTGNEATFGQWSKEGIELATDDVNRAGGINSSRLSVVYEDSRSDPKTALSGLRKLIDVNKVPVIIGETTSAGTLACAPEAEKAKVVLITPTAGSPDIANAGDYIFRTRESGEAQAEAFARYVRNTLELTRVAILYPKAANAEGYRKAFVPTFESAGGQIVADEGFAPDAIDLSAQLTKIRNSNPEAVYVPGTAAQVARALKQGRELGVKAQFLSSAAAEAPELLDIAGTATEGLIYASFAFDPKSGSNQVSTFVSAYQNRYGKLPTPWAANAYDAVRLVAEAIKKVGTDSTKIKDFLYGVKNYPGVSGTISFDAKGEAQKPVSVKKVEDGQFKFVTLITNP